uniref:Uncharacterized protein n=1 Tax=Anguilla anguilla TaxID=7936 RepID=A0A0E9TTB1_ANGAN
MRQNSFNDSGLFSIRAYLYQFFFVPFLNVSTVV